MRPLWTVEVDGGPRRVNHSAVLIGRTIFTFGGYSSSEEKIFQTHRKVPIDIFAFNTATLRWTKVDYLEHQHHQTISHVPYMRYGHAMVAIDEIAYLFGGRDDYHGACNKLFSFDTDSLCWKKHQVSGQIPCPRDGHGMCVAKGNIYVFGGFVSDVDAFMDEVFTLDTTTMNWAMLPVTGQMGLWRDFHTLTSHGDRIYMFGGRSEESEVSGIQRHKYSNDIKVLDINSLAWSSVAEVNQKLPSGRRSHTAFFHKDFLYVFGGYISTTEQHFNDIWKFDSNSGLWSEVTTSGEKPCERRRHCCCYLNGKAYVFGGTSPSSTSCDEEGLLDLSDLHILDLEPSLKTLCIDFILRSRHRFDLSVLPKSLREAMHCVTISNSISVTGKE